MLTRRRIALVQSSVRQVAPIAEQGRTLMAAIGLVVGSLRDMERIAPVLATLGAQHAGHGVAEAQDGTVGAALLWTLRQGLGEAFTPEVDAAWAAAYGAVAGAMQAGAAAPAEAA